MQFETLLVTHPFPFVAHVQLNRPSRRNALDHKMWTEIPLAINALADDEDTRVIVLSGKGKSFCSGIDLQDMQKKHQELVSESEEGQKDIARQARAMGKMIRAYQQSLSSLEDCPKPVIASIHGHCLGGGVDIIAACDIRWATAETVFSIKEVDIGLCADVGSLNRLPKICGNSSWVRELAFSARNFSAQEALNNGLLSRIFDSSRALLEESLLFAVELANKSPIAMQGTKVNLNYSRDHTVKESLEYTALWNQSQLLTEDIPKAVMAALSKSEAPLYSKL